MRIFIDLRNVMRGNITPSICRNKLKNSIIAGLKIEIAAKICIN
jgi:hypothetical protein